MPVEYIDRPPRIQPELPYGEVPIPQPPSPERNQAQSVLQMIVPLISILGFVFVSGTGQIGFILPMLLAMVVSIGVGLMGAGDNKKAFEKKRRLYLELLSQMRQDMVRSHNTQRTHYQHNYPDINTILDIAQRKETSRFGSRLWERRPSDPDFGAVRLGVGNRPSTVVYKVAQGDDPLQPNPLAKDAEWLATDSAILTNAAITVPLRPYVREGSGEGGGPGNIAARHSLGLFGKNPTNTADLARAMLTHLTAFHSALDTRLYVVGLPGTRASWQWAEWLPHCNVRGVGDDDDAGQAQQLDQLCFAPEKDKVSDFWKRVKRELDTRQVRLRDTSDEDKKSGGDVTLPLLVVVVDLLADMPADSPLKEVASEQVVALINSSGPTLGACIIFLAREPAHIPSDCLAMVEVASVGGRTVFRYTEIGLNTPRYIGDADVINAADARTKFASAIRRLDLRRSFGADLPRAVDLLQMHTLMEGRKVDTVDKINIKQNWEWSYKPQNSEWLSAPIGLLSMREVRTLIFSAKEGGDGVHGMIAGTTGSGKSEFLLTLIAEMAVKYDPRLVNFVLVDFKGGAAFEPFKKLPHVVDILTNLEANAVARMFVAINAVMEDRAAILARSGAKDLVDYRKKIIPKLKPDDPLPKTFPHLFIIVDEFAEMITQNPDYKAQFESVTRLGRAFGVSLLLATQRPAGMVTDQMRANMKFRVCLRVETPEDSKELLGRPDAAFLPNIGGRGYIQVGNDILSGVQVAWGGKEYSDERTEDLKDVIWLDEERLPASAKGAAALYSSTEIAEALGLKPGEKPATVIDWLVGIAALRSRVDGVPKQTKPWPEPLPAFLSLTEPVNAKYLNTERDLGPDRSIVINEAVDAWFKNAEEKSLWQPFDWKTPQPLRADIGLVDNPYRAEQRLLSIDLSSDPLAIFGASGRGKSTFIKTLLLALAAQRSPAELHMYALDFGRGGLKAVRDLPHLGAVIDAGEVARVDQLMRMLRGFVNERQERLAKYANLADFNAKNPNQVFPEIIVIIDNFAEFKESYEHLIPDLMATIRDGRAFGIYFILTGNTPGDMTGKLLNLLTQRLALTMSDPIFYGDVVGSGARPFDNTPGRGLVAVAVKDKPIPLEFQVGFPGSGEPADIDQPDPYIMTAQRMEKVWFAQGGKRPAAELPRAIDFFEMFALIEGKKIEFLGDLPFAEHWKASMQPENQDWLKAPIGLISSKEVRTMIFSAKANGDGVHGMVAGTTGSGKSELLLSMIAAMAVKYDPRIVNFVLVDFKGGAAFEPFKKLPHCVDIATNLMGNAVERIFIAVKAEMDRRAKLLADGRVGDLVDYRKRVIPKLKLGDTLPNTFPHLFIIVDEFAEMIAQNPEYKAQFESVTRLGRAFGVTLILATQRPAGAVTDQMRSNMKFRICLRVETPEDSKELLKRPDAARLPPIGGRGYIQVGNDLLTEVQVAWAGREYTISETRPDPVYTTEEILEAMNLKPDNKPGLMIDWVVGAAAAQARRDGVPRQRKPWPDPLPEQLPLNRPIDANYLQDGQLGKEIVLNPRVLAWIENTAEKSLWERFDWSKPLPMKCTFGIIDNPFQSEQRLLTLDLAADPIVVFGASGRGKSTFVKTVLLSMAAQHSPHLLHMYALDFGRGGLKGVRALPHLGASIDASQPERVEQLFRMLRGMMVERQERLAKFASLEDYNAQYKDQPEFLFPSAIVVIDNFAEFRENYDPLMPELIALVRDGRAFGIYFIITASAVNDLSGKLYNLLTTRVTFTMADTSAYVDIVGRGALSLGNVPGRGLINIEGQPLEFHVGVPVMENEKDPFSRLSERMEKVWLAQGGKRPAAEIPRGVDFLDMFALLEARKIEFIGDLKIAEKWKASMQPENQEWLKAPLGLISSKEVRTMNFSAKAGGDGVHGMVAGTTGSGKSELLLSMIAAMAIKYDPRIVNFVLVDFKGGAAFEPFKKLPHCVDIATNLQGNAVERIFIAVKAEMDRRSKLLADGRVGDLVDYRKRVIPRLRPGDPLPNTFPHLFIIVDEFAEMIAANPEYKAQFESITRLGRAFGVTLILATQRPAGSVTDQMRSNMKFRICLRVETSDDSKELLKRPDAAMLPAIGGRGYIQVGGGSLSEVQVAWAGKEYTDTKPDPDYSTDEILEAMDLRPENKPGLMIDWIVGCLAAQARRDGVPKQYKPWPNPLPTTLALNKPIDATYIELGARGLEIMLNPMLAEWMDNDAGLPLWKPVDGTAAQSLNAALGIVDNPYRAEQRVLEIDLTADPVLIFGAAGRGKTMFVKTLILSLAAQRSPAELHFFILDFGRGGLKGLRALPHVAGIVDTNEEERVERLLRMVRHTIDDRQQKLQAYDSLADYNVKHPDSPMPAVVVVVDNVSEFKEGYDRYQYDLIMMIRDGRTFGVYFVVTGTLFGDVPNKLFNLLGQRLTLTMPDPSDYTMIVGRGWSSFNDEPGRGLAMQVVGEKPIPLEFHTAIPVSGVEGDTTDHYRELAQKMEKAWNTLKAQDPSLKAKGPKVVEPLAKLVPIAGILPPLGEGAPNKAVPVGINDLDREPLLVEFGAKGPHWIVVGPPVTGKTTVVRSLVMSLAQSYPPEKVAMVLVDPSDASRRFYNIGSSGETSLDKLPHVLATVTNAKEMSAVIKRLRAEYDEEVIGRLQGQDEVFTAQDNTERAIFVILDHYDDAEGVFQKTEPLLTLLSEVGKGKNLHLVISGSLNIMRSSADDLRRRAEGARYTLVLQDYEAVRYMGARGNFTITKELPPGRGFMVKAVTATLVQMAMPFVEGASDLTPEEQLDRIIVPIQQAYGKAQWSYHADDLAALDKAINPEPPPADANGATPAGTATPVPGAPDAAATSDAMAEIQKLMAMQSGMTEQFMNATIPDGSNFASVEIPDTDEAAVAANGESTNGSTANSQAAHAPVEGQSNGQANGSAEAEPAASQPSEK